eukprot:TRINITY_DN9016_c0_g2_i2.p1 TRINITY_DN9016_c0_g2~~TRINITY_DN9016_c0_g2_i2.p1  ORF type:complete len:274 (-),score=11.59 TRINITY_DN9016_c0_g2_i2:1351-2112(-)
MCIRDRYMGRAQIRQFLHCRLEMNADPREVKLQVAGGANDGLPPPYRVNVDLPQTYQNPSPPSGASNLPPPYTQPPPQPLHHPQAFQPPPSYPPQSYPPQTYQPQSYPSPYGVPGGPPGVGAPIPPSMGQPGYPSMVDPGMPAHAHPLTHANVVHIRQSITLFCPTCNQQRQTLVIYQPGVGTISMVVLIIMLGGILGCCLIPCFMNDCKNAVHSCPACGTSLGTSKFLCQTCIQLRYIFLLPSQFCWNICPH